MREILFRGQTRRKGERVWIDGTPVDSNWVYGGVSQGKGDFSIIYQTEPEIHKFPVYTDTIGQYTGLKDKNGKKIFEGDILSCPDLQGNPNYCVVKYGNFNCNFCESVYGWYFDDGDIIFCHDYVIVGNVYDNPELLKGEEL